MAVKMVAMYTFPSFSSGNSFEKDIFILNAAVKRKSRSSQTNKCLQHVSSLAIGEQPVINVFLQKSKCNMKLLKLN